MAVQSWMQSPQAMTAVACCWSQCSLYQGQQLVEQSVSSHCMSAEYPRPTDERTWFKPAFLWIHNGTEDLQNSKTNGQFLKKSAENTNLNRDNCIIPNGIIQRKCYVCRSMLSFFRKSCLIKWVVPGYLTKRPIHTARQRWRGVVVAQAQCTVTNIVHG